jgi:hypothetical protein
MMQNEFEWTEEERRAMESLGDDVHPSDTLRPRTLRSLREHRLAPARQDRRSALRPAIGVAAALALVAGVGSYFSLRSTPSADSVRVTDSVTFPAKPAIKIERHIIWY